MAKYLSRAKRLDQCIDVMDEISVKLNELIDNLEEENCDIKTIVIDANSALSNFDYSEIESLKEEIESWHDNMRGTNLENSSKYEVLEECLNSLADVINKAESLKTEVEENEKEALRDEIQNIVDGIEEIINDASCIEFPGMY
jgi:hypothetical protein